MPNVWTPLTDGNSASQAARSGSTTVWVNPNNVLVLDQVYTTASPMSPGSITQTLKMTGAAPSPIIPTSGATLLGAELWVTRHQNSVTTPGDGLEYGTIDDLVQISKSGTAVGSNLAQNVPVPETDTDIVYSFDPVADGFTIADINAGDCGCLMGWTCPGNSHTYDSANWSIAIVPTSPNSSTGLNSTSLTTNFVVSVTWIGTPGGQPPFVVVNLSGDALATATNHPLPIAPEGFTGTASANNGLGEMDAGSIKTPPLDPPPGFRQATGTLKRRLALVGTVATTTVTMVSSISVVGTFTSQDATVAHTLSAAVVTPEPTELFVDAARIRYLYSTTGGIGFSYSDAQMSRIPDIGVYMADGPTNHDRGGKSG